MNRFSKIILSGLAVFQLVPIFASHSSVQEPTVGVGSANHRNVRRLSSEVKNWSSTLNILFLIHLRFQTININTINIYLFVLHFAHGEAHCPEVMPAVNKVRRGPLFTVRSHSVRGSGSQSQ